MTADKQRIISFVMSGGVGSRLWPLSREDFPKQFHNLSGQGSMLLRTVKRMGARTKAAVPVYLLASERHADHINQDIAGVDLAGGRPILEPMGRNTASAVVLATEITLREHGDELVLVVPSDHEITTDRDFWNTVETGIGAANAGRIVVFGIQPDRPETGYGYIEVELGGFSNARRSAFRGEAERSRRPGNIWNPAIFSGMPGFSSFVPASCAMHSGRTPPKSGTRRSLRSTRRTPTFPAPICRMIFTLPYRRFRWTMRSWSTLRISRWCRRRSAGMILVPGNPCLRSVQSMAMAM